MFSATLQAAFMAFVAADVICHTVYCPNYVSVLLNRRRISVLILFHVSLRKLLAFFFSLLPVASQEVFSAFARLS